MRGRWITAGCFVVLAAGAAVCALQPVARPARKYDIAPYDELTEKIRAGLEGTTSRCELGPPSAEDQEGWKQLQEPRKLGRHSLTDLLREPDEELSLEVYSRLLDELWSTGLGAMTEPERNVALVNELQAEVVNGGFHQYFSNSSGNCASKILAASRAIDNELSKVVERALALFPDSKPSEDRATRSKQMASIKNEYEAWSQLDDQFYKLPLEAAVSRYIRANSTAFDSPPQAGVLR